MTEQIDPTRRAKSFPAQAEETHRRQPSGKAKTQTADRVSIGDSAETEETYGPGLKAASSYELLRNLVVKTLREQGVNLRISTGATEIDLNSLSQEEARELISADGYFGVEQTSQRIVDFAVAAFGHDPARLEEMKAEIDKGFQEAQEAFGGALPDISQQTYAAIMDKLDAFAARFEQAEE